MKWLRIAPKWISIIVVTGGILVAIHAGIKHTVARTYHTFINDPTFVEAFASDNKNGITALAQQHNLQYQRVTQGNLTQATHSNLPIPQLIAIKTAISPGVLPEMNVDLLNNLTPAYIWKKGALYAVIPVFPPNLDKTGYIIYAKAWP